MNSDRRRMPPVRLIIGGAVASDLLAFHHSGELYRLGLVIAAGVVSFALYDLLMQRS